jgi:hypothetical protein
VPPCEPYSFSVEARVIHGAPANTASGHFNRTQSATIPITGCPFPGTVSQLRVDIDCLLVTGSIANMSGVVSKSTGFFSTAAGGNLTPGTRVVIGASDNPDGIAYRVANPGTEDLPTATSCGYWTQVPITAGNITIND